MCIRDRVATVKIERSKIPPNLSPAPYGVTSNDSSLFGLEIDILLLMYLFIKKSPLLQAKEAKTNTLAVTHKLIEFAGF